MKLSIRLHPWLNTGLAIVYDNQGNKITSQYFSTGEVEQDSDKNEKKRIEDIRNQHPGVIETAEKKASEVFRLLEKERRLRR